MKSQTVRRKALLALVVLAGTALSSGAPASAASETHSGIVAATAAWRGSVELQASRNPKWRSMYARHSASGGWGRLADKLNRIRATPRDDLLEEVNDLVNRARQVSDRRNWQSGDYWAAPAELFRRGGDCEDFAIAKYLLLRELGVPSSQMQILITRDHAVLVVRDEEGLVVLDSLRRRIYQLSPSQAARAVFALNEKTWWVNTGGAPQVASR
jgi:predicted transglutaminase-like cysteine proteinase